MDLSSWTNEKKITDHKTSKQEIQNLIKIVDRDINDASIDVLSADRRFIIAYNAALQLATIILHCNGYRTKHSRGGHHWITFAILPDMLGEKGLVYSDYYNTCRIKRNKCDYTNAEEISENEANELLIEVSAFREFVVTWLQDNYPQYL